MKVHRIPYSDDDRVSVKVGFSGVSASGTARGLAKFGLVGLCFIAGVFWLWNKYEDKKLARDQRRKAAQKESSEKSNQEENSLPQEPVVASTKSFEEMEASPMCTDQGWIVDGMFPKGQISAYVAGADTGKTIAMVDVALAASKGTVPTFLPEDRLPSENVDVVYYRLEPRPGENEKRGYTSDLFPSCFSWATLEDLPEPTQCGLVSHITAYAHTAKRDTLFIVDPLSKFKGDFDAGKFYSAMKDLNVKAAAKGLCHTFIASVHADEKKSWSPASSEDIKGGDTLIQQWDAVFMLCKERRNGYRFIQALKPPKGSSDSDNVIVTKFSTDGYTHHLFDGFKPMTDALPLRPKATDSETKESVSPLVNENYTLTDEEVLEIIDKSKPRPGKEERHNVSRGIQDFIQEHNVKVVKGTVRNTFYSRCKEMGITPKGEPRSPK